MNETSPDEIHEDPVESTIVCKSKSKRRKTQGLTEQYLSLKEMEYRRREARHRDRLEIEEKKIALLEKYLEKNEKS